MICACVETRRRRPLVVPVCDSTVRQSLLPERGSLEATGAQPGQERLFGAKASETTTHRVLKSVDERLLGQVRAARAPSRAQVWDTGARPETITLMRSPAAAGRRAFGWSWQSRSAQTPLPRIR